MENSFETILLQGWRGEYGEVLEGILVSVFLKKWNLFLLVGDEILFFYRFIGDLDWDSRYSPFSSLLFLYRIFLVIYFIFRISCVEVEFERLYRRFLIFCFFESLLEVLSVFGIFINFLFV